MFSWLEQYLFKNAAAKALSALLSKLPADGGKTFLGVLLLVLGEVAKAMPAASFSPFVAALIEVAQSAGPAAVVNAGLATFIVGALHKILKFFNPGMPDAPQFVQ